MRKPWSVVAVIAVAILALPPAAATAADPTLPDREAVDRLAKPLVDEGWCEGLAIGVINEHGRQVYGYGKLSATNPSAPDGDTIFEIGSITKAFTGTLLADMVKRGEVALDDPVQKYLPGYVLVPQRGDKPITLRHLAAHTSGLPRLPGNFRPADPANPYADYTVDQMYAFINECKPAREPGKAYEYSNLGTGLLGHALARRAGKPYEALLAERVLKPAGMNDTRIALSEAHKSRLAIGHDADGSPLANWDIPTLAGAGALRSTANDMLKFLAANLDAKGPLAEAAALARKPVTKAMPHSQIALGWHVGDKGAVWHNGQTGGYHSYCAYVPERRVGVVVLSNTGTGLVDALGVRLVKQLCGEPAEPIALRKTVDLAPDVLDKFVGRYVLTPVFALEVSREGERLYCQATAQPRFRIYPESDTTAFYKVVDAKIEFSLDKPGNRAWMLTLHQNGLKLPGLRADGTPATLPATQQAATKPASAAAEAPAGGAGH